MDRLLTGVIATFAATTDSLPDRIASLLDIMCESKQFDMITMAMNRTSS